MLAKLIFYLFPSLTQFNLRPPYDMDYGTYEEIYRSPVWKNGTEIALEVVSSDNFTVWGLACAFVDTQE